MSSAQRELGLLSIEDDSVNHPRRILLQVHAL